MVIMVIRTVSDGVSWPSQLTYLVPATGGGARVEVSEDVRQACWHGPVILF